ncbi:hypothetical protein ACVWWG_004602 [Bradyrhizobium sp. LB7.2]
MRCSGSICTAAVCPVPVVVTTVDCAIAPVEISAAAAEISSNFFITFSLPLDCVPAFQTSANPMTHGLRIASSSAVSAKRLGMLSRFARSVRKAF